MAPKGSQSIDSDVEAAFPLKGTFITWNFLQGTKKCTLRALAAFLL